MNIPVKAFNWILKNVYNYNGQEVSKNNSFGYNIIDDEIYFWLPPDEGGLYGEFRMKDRTLKDGKYVVKYEYYGAIDPFVQNPEYEHAKSYTVTASLKTVKDINNNSDINVWTIESTEITWSKY